MILPHVAMPIIVGEDPEKTKNRPSPSGANHWHQFVDAVQGNGKTSAHFGYSGPLTESILLGGVASRYPGEKLLWNARKLEFSNKPEAGKYVRKTYRKGWDVPGLS